MPRPSRWPAHGLRLLTSPPGIENLRLAIQLFVESRRHEGDQRDFYGRPLEAGNPVGLAVYVDAPRNWRWQALVAQDV